VVDEFDATFPLTVIPGAANTVFAVAVDFGLKQLASKYNVTLDGSEAVPKIVGVSVAAGFEGLIEANVNVGGVIS
jgi:hypothetical protein